MRRAILLLFLALPAFAQTAKFPTAVATDADLTVQKDKAQSTITAPMNASQTSVTVVTGSKFIAGMIVSIDNEQALVCSVVGTTVSFGYASCPNVDGRGYAGTVAASHSNGALISGNIVAWNHNSVAAEVKAIEAALGTNLGNIPTPTLGSLGAAARGANSDITSLSALSTPLTVPQGGTGAAALTGIVQGNGASAETAVAAASEGQVLRRKFNAGTTPVYEFATTSSVASSDYNFAAQSPGGSLSVGSNTIALSPVPLGVNGSNTQYRMYISGGVGTAEPCLVTGGTAVSGAASGTVIVTCANTHSGAWTISSASGGIKEASAAAGGKGVINLPSGDINIRGTLVLPTTQSIIGQGSATTAAAGTNTTLICAAAASPCLVVADGLGTATNQGVGRHSGYSLLGPGSGYGLWIGGDPSSVFAPTAWTGSYVRFEHINVTGFTEAVYHRMGNFVDYSGMVLTGTTTAFHIPSDCGGEMQPINIYNSLISTPPGGASSIDMDCSGTLSGPVTVFGGQISGTVIGDAVDLEFFGVHFEANENHLPLLNVTSNAQHLVRIHGGILAFHGANATTLTSGIIMSGAGLYGLSIEGAWIQADGGYTVTNLVEFNPTLGGDLILRHNHIALAGTFTNMLSATLTTMQVSRISIEQPMAPSSATGITAGATVTFPAGNYPVMQPARIFGATVGGGITAVAGLRAYSSGTLSTSAAQTFTAGATIGNTITTTAGLPYTFYYDGTQIWIK